MSISNAELRKKQIREVLDYDRNISKQVFNREKTAIANFENNIVPRTERDTDAEITVDKGVEQVNSILTNKLNILDTLLTAFSSFNELTLKSGRPSANSQATTKMFAEAVSYGDFLAAYNNLMRTSAKVGLSDITKNLLKVKYQEMKSNLDAMVYGLTKVMDNIFSFEESKSNYISKVNKQIFPLLHSLSVYRNADDQLRTNSYHTIENIDMQTSFKQLLSEMSEERRELIMELQRKNPKEEFTIDKVLRNYPVFEGENVADRIKALENELGVNIPQNVIDDLKQVSGKDVDTVIKSNRETKQLEKIKDSLNAQDANLDVEQVLKEGQEKKQEADITKIIAAAKQNQKDIAAINKTISSWASSKGTPPSKKTIALYTAELEKKEKEKEQIKQVYNTEMKLLQQIKSELYGIIVQRQRIAKQIEQLGEQKQQIDINANASLGNKQAIGSGRKTQRRKGREDDENKYEKEEQELADDFIIHNKGAGRAIPYNDTRNDYYTVTKHHLFK